MANSIEYAKKFVPVIDRIYKNGSYTAGLDSKTDIDFTGVNEVKILKISTTGLGDYSRTNGYPKGDVTVAWETITLEEERGKEISIDRMDNEETLGTAFGEVTSQFMTQFVNPELDAYRFAKYAQNAGTKVTGTLTKDNVITAFDNAILALDNAEVPQEGRAFYVSTNLRPVISSAIARQWGSDKAINTAVDNYNGIPIVYVVPTRFYSSITLNSGATEFGYRKTEAVYELTKDTTFQDGKDYYTKSGTTYEKATVSAGGSVTASTYYELTTPAGADINFMLVHGADVMQAVKFAMPKVFTPDENQDKDMWKFQIRIYHDAYVYDNKKVGVYVHTK